MAEPFGQNLIELLPNLRRFALSITRSATKADDLVQITCEKALANQTSYQTGTRLDAWLFRIMRNSWIDQIRRDKTSGPKIDIDDAFDLAGEDGRKTTENSLMVKTTRNAIASLPDDQREVLVLICVEELSYQETADLLEVPIGTVMSRLARARKKISAAMGINRQSDRSSKNKEL